MAFIIFFIETPDISTDKGPNNCLPFSIQSIAAACEDPLPFLGQYIFVIELLLSKWLYVYVDSKASLFNFKFYAFFADL